MFPSRPIFVLCLLAALNACAVPAVDRPAPAVTVATPQPTPFIPPTAPGLPPVFPGDDWSSSDPAAQGLDPQRLQDLLDQIPSRAPTTSSVLIVRHGQVVLEQYYGASSAKQQREIYSVTKSVVATLVGIGLDQGWLRGLDMPLTELFPNHSWQNAEAAKDALTLENMLTMSTGLDWSEDDINRMYGSPNWIQFMLDLPLAEPPGQRFNYCTGCSHLLLASVAQAGGMDALSFAQQYLFEPIGIRRVDWNVSSEGQPIGGWGLQLTTRDLARIGYLYLRQGQWDGRQIVSPEWVQAATREHIPADNGLGYGYQWWIRPSMHGYAALGRSGQMIAVIPEADLVVVFTAHDGEHPVEFELIEQYVLPAVK